MYRRSHKITLNQSRGIVLPSVLWITILTIVVAVNYASAVHVNTRATDNIKTSMMLKYDATSGIYLALDRLLSDPSNKNTRFRVSINNSIVEVEVKPENLKTDLNSATEAEIRTAFIDTGIDSGESEILAARVIDWRDRDSLARPNGMEDTDYFNSNRKYGAKDGRIEDLVELLLIADIERNIFRRLTNDFTVYSKSAGKIYTLTAWTGRPTGEKSYVSTAIVQITRQRLRPYRILKWQHNHG